MPGWHPKRRAVTTVYDVNSNVVRSTDFRGQTTAYQHDRLNREGTRKAPDTFDHRGSQSGVHYYPDSSTKSTTLHIGDSTHERGHTFDYDNLGRQTDHHLPDVPAGSPNRNFKLDILGRQEEFTDEQSNTTTYGYDGLNRQSRVDYAASGSFVSQIFDTFGNLTSTTDPHGTTSYIYDTADRLTETHLPAPDASTTSGPVQKQEYDRLGNVTATINGENERTEYQHDQLNRVIRIDYANGESTILGYDLLGRQNYVEDGGGNVTRMIYDDLDRLVREEITVGGGTQIRSWTYDAAGNVKRSVDRQGKVKKFTYDELGRLKQERWYESETATAPAYSASYTYHTTGMIESVTDNHSTYSYDYDKLNRMTDEVISLPNTPIITLLPQYAFNNTDRLDSLPGGLYTKINGVDDFENVYQYDANLRLTDIDQVSSGGNNFPLTEKHIHFDYDASNRLDLITRSEAGTDIITSDYDYDNLHRLSDLAHTFSGNTIGYTWTYDAAHRVDTFDSPDGLANYAYDDNGQLVSADYANQSSEAYDYDDAGNRDTFTVDVYNRITYDGIFTYTYDAEGNRSAKFQDVDGNETVSVGDTDITTYDWDIKNRLTAVTTLDASLNPTNIVEYEYDAYDRRISKSFDTDGNGTADHSEHYVYDGEHILYRFTDDDGPSGSNLSELSNRYLHGPGVDMILADEQLTADVTSSEVLWPLTDHLGTPRDIAVADGNGNTTVANHITYDAFGNAQTETDSAIDTIFGYTGRETDEESDLYFYRARYYDPQLGQFISEDPIGFAAGDANTRRYVGNSPTNATDPSGLYEYTPGKRFKHGQVSADGKLFVLDVGIRDKTGKLRTDVPIKNGEVDFSPWARKQFEMAISGEHSADASMASRIYKGKRSSEVFHHDYHSFKVKKTKNGKPVPTAKMQVVPKDLNTRVPHAGSAARARTFVDQVASTQKISKSKAKAQIRSRARSLNNGFSNLKMIGVTAAANAFSGFVATYAYEHMYLEQSEHMFKIGERMLIWNMFKHAREHKSFSDISNTPFPTDRELEKGVSLDLEFAVKWGDIAKGYGHSEKHVPNLTQRFVYDSLYLYSVNRNGTRYLGIKQFVPGEGYRTLLEPGETTGLGNAKRELGILEGNP